MLKTLKAYLTLWLPSPLPVDLSLAEVMADLEPGLAGWGRKGDIGQAA